MQTSLDALLRALLPNLSTMRLENCLQEKAAILLTLQPTTPTAACPACGQHSNRVTDPQNGSATAAHLLEVLATEQEAFLNDVGVELSREFIFFVRQFHGEVPSAR